MPDLIPPRTFKENIQYRYDVRKWALESKANRNWLIKKCREDFFFFCETFLFLYEPRPDAGGLPNIIPFIPWDHQRPAMQTILDNLGFHDIGLEKARGEGASWTCTMIILWRWLFYDMQAFGLVSMNEDAADNQEDPDSLGYKIDWQLDWLPLWMTGKKSNLSLSKDAGYIRNISKHTWKNCRNGSTITAYACTADLASGGRKLAFLMDELAKFDRGPDEDAMSSTEPVTNCRLLVSTPKGANGAYYRAMKERSSMIKIVLDWTKNPTRNQNLFTIDMENNRLELVDPANGNRTKKYVDQEYQTKFFRELLPDLINRGFPVETRGKLWSPWYVERCLRPRMDPKKIAQEYDRDYIGSSSRFFPASTIEMLIEKTLPPMATGEVVCDYEDFKVTKFMRLASGHLKLWFRIADGEQALPPIGDYVIGIDVCTGVGGTLSSNSTASIANRKTGVKVAEYASPVIKPEKFAALCLCLAYWFKNESGGPAYLVWESNGPGKSFGSFILEETGFRNFHYRIPRGRSSQKRTKEAGWHSSKDSKRELLSNYRYALSEGQYENLSDIALRETMSFVEEPGGKIAFVSALSDEDDPANSGENHGDRVIADALSVLGMEELNGGSLIIKVDKKPNISTAPRGSFLHRQRKWLALQKKQNEW